MWFVNLDGPTEIWSEIRVAKKTAGRICGFQ